MAHIDEEAKNWLKWDPREESRTAVQAAVDSGDSTALTAMFGTRMAFGTAGLRAAMGPGTSRMNDLTIVQTTQGLLRYLQAQTGREKVSLAVGYDARHNSKRWGALVAAVSHAAGCTCHLYDGIVPTPLVPYAMTSLGCDAGVMITASHNPKQDNGYKVYWGATGAQIIPPHDAGIQKSILSNLAPWGDNVFDTSASHAVSLAGMKEKYLDALAPLSSKRWSTSPASFIYTAMHGVGLEMLQRAFAVAELPKVSLVESQVQPDPEFPTVPFPNPEEKGALKEAMQAADKAGATVILANDPDADRLALAEKDSATGVWKVFSGNEIGAMLGIWAFQNAPKGVAKKDMWMLASLVSSRFLESVAKAEGFNFEVTQTGFKWMGTRAQALQKEGKTVLFAFEEAIGYMHPVTTVLDKDGISAAVAVAELVCGLQSKKRSLVSFLEENCNKYGWYCNNNSYFINREPALTDKVCFHDVRVAFVSHPTQQMFLRLRNWTGDTSFAQDGNTYPGSAGGAAIDSIEDLSAKYVQLVA